MASDRVSETTPLLAALYAAIVIDKGLCESATDCPGASADPYVLAGTLKSGFIAIPLPSE